MDNYITWFSTAVRECCRIVNSNLDLEPGGFAIIPEDIEWPPHLQEEGALLAEYGHLSGKDAGRELAGDLFGMYDRGD